MIAWDPNLIVLGHQILLPYFVFGTYTQDAFTCTQDDLFGTYTQDDFEKGKHAFAKKFDIFSRF